MKNMILIWVLMVSASAAQAVQYSCVGMVNKGLSVTLTIENDGRASVEGRKSVDRQTQRGLFFSSHYLQRNDRFYMGPVSWAEFTKSERGPTQVTNVTMTAPVAGAVVYEASIFFQEGPVGESFSCSIK
ncbi:MAG: hypothetical protein AB7O96_06165 [Pseudobdellovibrionaceae bacterium]